MKLRLERYTMQETTLCYIQKDNSYLMLFRNKKENDQSEGKWLGVGGHIEEGETPKECILREVKEETGLELLDCKYRGRVHFVSDIYEEEIMHIYTSDRFDGEIIECDEGELSWIPKSEILSLNLWEGDRIFLKLLIADEGFFSMRLEYIGDRLVNMNME